MHYISSLKKKKNFYYDWQKRIFVLKRPNGNLLYRKKKEKNKLTKMYSKHEWELISSPQRVFPVDEKLFHVLQPFIQTFIKIRIFGVNKL